MEEILDEMDPIEAEVDAIRRQLWEETKDMTMEERWTYMSSHNDPVLEKFNIKFVTLKPATPRRRSPEHKDS